MGYHKVTINTDQICDYLYATNKETVTDGDYVKVSQEPTWSGNASLLATFNSDKLIAGDPNLESSLVGCEIRRKKNSDPYTEYVATIDSGQNGYIVDYCITNNSYYIYYFYPQVKDSETGEIRQLNPLVTEQIKTSWDYWALMVVDETEDENVFYLSKMFYFKYNIESGEMSNNTDFSVSKNFTRYPYVQHSNANYWSGTLSGLVGEVSCPNVEYFETIDMLNDLKELTTDGKRKFLKDIDGNIFEVSLIDAISITNDNIFDIKTKTISWAEIGDVKGVSIISAPNTVNSTWVLTEDGISKPYLTYSWVEDGVWGENKYFTGNDG